MLGESKVGLGGRYWPSVSARCLMGVVNVKRSTYGVE